MSDLIDRLTASDGGLDAVLLVPLLKLLADGEPVDVNALAAAAGLPIGETEERLTAIADVERDVQGRIVGLGLTLRPTSHRFTVDGEELYTWCALDTLIFPIVLGRTAVIECVSPVGGQPIRVVVTPTGVSSIEPPTAVVSLVNPEQMTSIRSAFCNEVHYFASREDAAPWLDVHGGAEVIPVADAHELAVTLTARFLSIAEDTETGASRPHCC